MRVLLFGPNGVLGKTLTRISVRAEHTVIPVSRQMCNYLHQNSLVKTVKDSEPDVIVNCAGLNQQSADIVDVISINGLFPHMLLRASQGVPIIHISSCDVFSGRIRTRYSIQDVPDPLDYLGRSKSLGEIIGPNVCVIRTSILALEHGFMKFLFEHRGSRLDAWDNVLTTGGTVDDICEVILWLGARMIEGSGTYNGLVHVATELSTSKYMLACMINELFDLGMSIRPVYQPVINRSLTPTIVLRSIKESLEHYASANAVNEAAINLRRDSSQIVRTP